MPILDQILNSTFRSFSEELLIKTSSPWSRSAFHYGHMLSSSYCLVLKVLLAIGAKLEVIITQMCLKSSKKRIIISGEVSVDPSDKLFWFGKPQWILYAIQFVLIENSFQLAFVFWNTYTFGFESCPQRKLMGSSITIGTCLIVQFVCAHATLPLYALVSQMGSSMKETIFSAQVVAGLKRWHSISKRNLSERESIIKKSSSPLSKPPSTSSFLQPLSSPRALRRGGNSPELFGSNRRTSNSPRSTPPLQSPRGRTSSSELFNSNPRGLASRRSSLPLQSPRGGRSSELFSSNSRALTSLARSPALRSPRGGSSSEIISSNPRALTSPRHSPPLQSPGGGNSPELFSSTAFEFPKLRRDLVEIQKITEEMMGINRNSSVGEVSFRMWWAQEIISPIGGRSSPDR